MPTRSKDIRQRGFTLVELLLVLTIGAALIALAPPLIQKALPGVQIKGAAREVAAAMRAARNTAVSGNREAVFSIDVENRRYRVDYAVARPLPKQIEIELFTAESELESEGEGKIRFFSDGASTGGAVTLRHGNRIYKVSADWLTGLVRIADVDG